MSLHRCITLQTFTNPWPEPHDNSNDYWPEKIWQELLSNISNPYCFNTMLHQRTLQGRQYTHKSELLFPLSSNTASFVRLKISLFNAWSHQLTNSNKSIHYYIITSHQGWIHSLSTVSKKILYWLHKTKMKGIPHNSYRCGVTFLPPPHQLHKLPFNLTWDKYNHGMCVQVILTYVECGGTGTVWVRYFNAIHHLMLWLLQSQLQQHGILIYRYTAAQHRHAEQHFCPH